MCFKCDKHKSLRQHKMVSRRCPGSGAPLWLQQNDRLSLLVFSGEMSLWRRNVRRPKAQPPSSLVPTTPPPPPHSRSGWWERVCPDLGKQLPPRNRWSWGKYFRVLNAETIALRAHRWISRLAPTQGFNVSSPKPSDTLTSLYIIPKKLTASCNWNWISGSSIAAVPSPPFTLALHLLSLHL